MPPSDDNTKVITNTTSTSSSCSLPPSNSTNNDCTAAVIPTNCSTLVKNPIGKVPSVFENDPILEDEKVDVTSEDTTIKDAACVTMKEPEEKGQHQDREEATATQQKEYSKEDQKDSAATKHKEETTEEDTESPKVDANKKEVYDDSSNHPESKSSTQQNIDDDIEWLSPLSIPRVKQIEDGANDTIEVEEKKESASMKPLKMLRKSAVAAVGGTMVGVGLVMIPLPTPFGAIVASSGLAVLGTEFDDAKKLNDRLINGAKGHLNTARDAMVKGIENMNQDENADTSGSSNTKTLNGDDNSVENKELREAGPVIKVNASTTFGSDNDIDGNETEESENSESDSTSESPPVWLHMNAIERNRQEKLAKAKYRQDSQTSYEQAKEAFTKRTGKFLSRNILPFIKKTEPSAGEGQTTDIDTSITLANIDGNSDIISIIEKGGDLQTKENRTNTKPETKEEKLRKSCTSETNDNDYEGYAVISQDEQRIEKLKIQESSSLKERDE